MRAPLLPEPPLPTLLRPGRRLAWPLLLLVASLVVTAVVALQAERSARLQRRTAEQLLRDYSAFAAWSYGRHANSALLEAAWQVLNPILHRELHMGVGHPSARTLIGYYRESLAACACTPAYRPASYFAYTLGADTMDVAGAPLDSALRRSLADTLGRLLRAPRATDRMGVVAAHVAGAERVFAYGTMPTAQGDTIVYGFTFEPGSVPALLAEVFASRTLLPGAVTRGAANDSILAVRVTSRGGEPLYASSDEREWARAASDTLMAPAAGLLVSATVREPLVRAVTGGARPQTLPLLALLVLAVALTVVASRQLGRERELVELRSEFVASVSHELRTPLAQVRLFLETLRLRRYATEEQREWLLGHLDRETTRLTQLVENVLHFSRSERPEAGAPLRAADVGAEIDSTVRAFAPLARARDTQIETELVGALGALVDPSGFRQLLLNLLDNAVKYGPSGQTIAVRAERRGGVVRVAVSDEGPGIPAAERERIWEPYYRGRSPAIRAVGGSGIGLAVARDVAERHGGRIYVDGAAARGATVVVELPAGAAAPGEAALEHAAAGGAS